MCFFNSRRSVEETIIPQDPLQMDTAARAYKMRRIGSDRQASATLYCGGLIRLSSVVYATTSSSSSSFSMFIRSRPESVKIMIKIILNSAIKSRILFIVAPFEDVADDDIPVAFQWGHKEFS